MTYNHRVTIYILIIILLFIFDGCSDKTDVAKTMDYCSLNAKERTELAAKKATQAVKESETLKEQHKLDDSYGRVVDYENYTVVFSHAGSPDTPCYVVSFYYIDPDIGGFAAYINAINFEIMFCDIIN